ncbi:MAG: PEP-CTERM-box response regulator transcription factor, partial [Thiogranum sp.]
MTTDSRKLLVVEDDPGLQTQLKWCFEGYDVIIAGDRETALAELEKHRTPVVTLDLGLPPDADGTGEGFQTLEAILTRSPNTKVIVVTGNNDRQHALQAVGMGAYDFFYKPIDAELLGFIVNRAYRLREIEDENLRLHVTGGDSSLEGVITGSPEMLKVCTTVEKVAPSDATVLILGESGTGKELIARSVHSMSGRADGKIVAINCAAIPENLLESELFGYEKGAFTGAVKQTQGKIELANGGTLFLDEVGDMPMSLQAKLLRFLQERIIERVGGRQEIPVDVRVICATHKDLPQLAREKEFREDLYYRISEISIRIPALREREGDTLLLARVFLEKFSKSMGKQQHRFSKESLAAIEAYPWPGNVRELENRVKRAVIMAEHKQISVSDLELGGAGLDDTRTFNLREIRE